MEERKNIKIYKTIMLIIVVAMVTFIITSVAFYNNIKNMGESKNQILFSNDGQSKIISTINYLKRIIDDRYLGKVDEEKLNEGAIKGYIEALDDPYTEYFTKEEMEEFEIETTGNFVGIGIYMTKDVVNNTILVLAPIENSPAYEAGILPGDVISKVDGVSYTGDDMSIASSKIKGEEGTTVELEIIRDNDEVLNFTIKREKVKLNPIKTEVYDNNIGYISFTSFDEDCSKEFEEKYKELKEKNIDSLIIDLRNNGGGIVDEALNIADLIVDKGSTTLITVDKDEKETISKSKINPIIDVPIVVLVNENTASASEILAAALKDNGKATIVGKNTYGKGVIQQLITLSDGSGIKITTNEYYTPNKNKINEIGIKPDIEVNLPKDVENILLLDEEDDTQLKKAIEYLK